jgi:uncharacterized membrane protein
MRSTARVSGHPIHPMLIPFPFAFLTGAAFFDVLAATRRETHVATTARHLGTAGLVTAMAAAVPGLIDYATVVPAGAPRRTATAHMLTNVSALLCFFTAARARRNRALPSNTTLSCSLIGSALLFAGGWLGGSLSYHHQIGVDPEAPSGGVLPAGTERSSNTHAADAPYAQFNPPVVL